MATLPGAWYYRFRGEAGVSKLRLVEVADMHLLSQCTTV